MKKTIISLCLLIVIAVQAQKEKAEAYVEKYKELAIAEMLRTGVPASIKLAQGILESQSGESDLAKTSNNHFGIKCKTEWTGAKTYHDDDEKNECFRVYPSVEASYMDHSDFLRSRPHYAFLFELDPTDYIAWANGLKKAGYATSPTYPQQLLKVINDYNLQQYSLEALARKKSTVGSGNKPIEPVRVAENISKQEKEPTLPETKSSRLFPEGVFTINHSKVVYAQKGASLLALANQYDIPLSRLLDFNELPPMDILDTDRLIFIEKKMKKGAIDYHVAANGESLYDISQLEGVRLEYLMEYNNLRKGAIPLPGDKIYLHAINSVSSNAVKPLK